MRPITLGTLRLLSKRLNLQWQASGHANTPLAMQLDVDFELVSEEQILDPRWQARLDAAEVDLATVQDAARERFNVIEETRATLMVCKSTPLALARRCMAAGDPAGCVEVLLRAIEDSPDDSDLWYLLATAMLCQGQLEGAELGLRRTLALDPVRVGAWSDLGLVLRRRGESAAAMEAVDKALALEPTHLPARGQHAALLAASGRYAAAVVVADALVADHPSHHGLRSNYGNYLRQARELDRALVQLHLAAEAEPENASSRWNLAIAEFQAGNYHDGFQSAEARFRRDNATCPQWADHQWDGTRRPDRTLLLETEQGFGDALQFVRFAHDAAQEGMHVVVRCHERLVPLLATAPGVSAAVPRHQEVAYDHIAYLMSLPARLGYGLDDVRRDGPYLAADAARAQPFIAALPAADLRIGVCWQGNPNTSRTGFVRSHWPHCSHWPRSPACSS